MLILYIFGAIFGLLIGLVIAVLIMVQKDKDTFNLTGESNDLKEINFFNKK
jgi:hypothetical protein